MIEDPVPPSHTRPAASTARAFSPDGYYRRFILASLALATLLGFALGLHVAATRLLDVGDPARTSDLIQAHGQIQLLGFAGLFVMGMGLRLMPTFAGARIAFGSFQGWIIALIAGSLVLRAVAMPLFDGDVHDAIFAASAYGLLLGAALFFFVTTATLTANARRFDSSSVAFIAGSGLLFLALLAAAFATIDAVGSGLKILPYLADTAVVHLEQTGFVLSFIVAVALAHCQRWSVYRERRARRACSSWALWSRRQLCRARCSACSTQATKRRWS